MKLNAMASPQNLAYGAQQEQTVLLPSAVNNAQAAEEPVHRKQLYKFTRNKWWILRIARHSLSIFMLGVGIWIVAEINQFYGIAGSLGKSAGYKASPSLSLLNKFRIIGCILIIAALLEITTLLLNCFVICQAQRKRRKTLCTGMHCVLALCVVAEFGAGVVLVHEWRIAEESTDPTLARALSKYTRWPTHLNYDGTLDILPAAENIDLDVMRTTVFINALQMQLGCCGVNGFADFNVSADYNTFPSFEAPVFCCEFADTNSRLLKSRHCYNERLRRTEPSSFFSKGCAEAIQQYTDAKRPHILSLLFVPVCLKIAFLLIGSALWVRSYLAWRYAQSICSRTAKCLADMRTDLTSRTKMEDTEHPYKDYEGSMGRLHRHHDAAFPGIQQTLEHIQRCLKDKHPEELANKYGQLPEEVLDFIYECNLAILRICQASPFGDISEFNVEFMEDLWHSLYKLRKSCTELQSAQAAKNQPQVLRQMNQIINGALASYNSCYTASSAAVNLAATKRFGHSAENILSESGKLVLDWASSAVISEEHLSAVLNQRQAIGGYFTPSRILAGYPLEWQEQAKADIAGQLDKFKAGVNEFLVKAKALSVMHNDDERYAGEWETAKPAGQRQ
ncbi:uncharacterized protein LOC129597417 isoform X2 [Paramacrobiotus metropolitanus]|uniref:uncharacterized protein LOC129597417 isoform X2 n=1 Tax=Paramacrobiotus metropolitanus TaxID=2943436 RepID=UPI0024461FEA|nr:uncharacterized protein LOC129597417 isoform X2 [Paramacrobiotus metropolitanus]